MGVENRNRQVFAVRGPHLDLVIGIFQDDVSQIEHGRHACAARQKPCREKTIDTLRSLIPHQESHCCPGNTAVLTPCRPKPSGFIPPALTGMQRRAEPDAWATVCCPASCRCFCRLFRRASSGMTCMALHNEVSHLSPMALYLPG